MKQGAEPEKEEKREVAPTYRTVTRRVLCGYAKVRYSAVLTYLL